MTDQPHIPIPAPDNVLKYTEEDFQKRVTSCQIRWRRGLQERAARADDLAARVTDLEKRLDEEKASRRSLEDENLRLRGEVAALEKVFREALQ